MARQAAAERLRRVVQPHRPLQLLSQTLFSSITEVQDAATRWLWTYNNERPYMALGGITPRQKIAMAA
jgi:transposase InsO family protein